MGRVGEVDAAESKTKQKKKKKKNETQWMEDDRTNQDG